LSAAEAQRTQLQTLLAQAGFDVGTPDGVVGRLTTCFFLGTMGLSFDIDSTDS